VWNKLKASKIDTFIIEQAIICQNKPSPFPLFESCAFESIEPTTKCNLRLIRSSDGRWSQSNTFTFRQLYSQSVHNVWAVGVYIDGNIADCIIRIVVLIIVVIMNWRIDNCVLEVLPVYILWLLITENTISRLNRPLI